MEQLITAYLICTLTSMAGLAVAGACYGLTIREYFNGVAFAQFLIIAGLSFTIVKSVCGGC